MAFVADASVTLPWCFEDEATAWTESLLDRLSAGEPVIFPAHWLVEVSNGLLMATRRKRIDQPTAERFLQKLASLTVQVEPPLSTDQARAVFLLSIQQKLTFYDAAYLELAHRKRLPLATLDAELVKAAKAIGVILLP